MSEVLVTQNYKKFKIMDGNPKLLNIHVRKLKKAIEEDNQLELHPIIVNKDFYVIDGQHRLQVAKELGLNIYYIKSDTVRDEHALSARIQQASRIEDRIDYFCIRQKKPEYILLRKMLNASGLRPKALLTLILGCLTSSILEFVKSGRFIFPEKEDPNEILEFYYDFSAYVKDKRITPSSMFSNHNFTRAFRWIFNTSGFDKETFFKKLDIRWFDLKPQRNAQEWYSLLIEIYNFKNHSKLQEEYGKNTSL